MKAKRRSIATLGKRIADAIAADQLPAAEKALEQLTSLAAKHTTTSEATTAVAELRARLAEEKQRAEEREARHQAHAAALLAAAADPKVTVARLEEDLAGFLREAGENRRERREIETRIDDRRQHDAVVARLAALDRAVLDGDAAAISAIDRDTTHASALASLAGQPGLVFASDLASFVRTGDSGTATVRIRHALASFPETILTYVYELRRASGDWAIIAAKRSE